MRDIKFREEITYRINEYLITTNVSNLRKGSKGWYKENGYIMRKVNYHPKQNKRGYVAEHRLVYERYLERFLDSKEVIHHINGNREDNRIENLQIVVENSEHIQKYHKKKTEIKMDNLYVKNLFLMKLNLDFLIKIEK